MAQFQVQWRYRSGFGTFEAGDVVDLSTERAGDINRDSPGVLVEVAEARALTDPPHDRQVKSPARRRDRQGDPSDQGAITKDNFKAVVEKPKGAG